MPSPAMRFWTAHRTMQYQVTKGTDVLLDTSRHETRGLEQARRERLLYLCDWLPPDYGAVGQYSLQFARELAAEGRDVVLAGLSSRASRDLSRAIGQARFRHDRARPGAYVKTSILLRLLWSGPSNSRPVRRPR